MPNTWKDIDSEQLRKAAPSTCRYCGEPIYWESLAKGKLKPVDATDLRRRHYCMSETAQAPRWRDDSSVSNAQLRSLVTETKEVNMPGDQAPLFTEAPAGKKAPTLRRDEAHIQYKLADGTPVPGVTAILGILNKPGLVHWAWELGRQNLDYREIRDNAADIGTLAHYLIMCHFKGETPDAPGCSAEDLRKANNCVAKFKNWLKEHPSLKPVMIEEPLVSEEFEFGGTLDLFADLEGEFVLVDLKTGKAIWPEMMYQLAAYRKLLEEQGWPVVGVRIFRIGVDEGEGFEELIKTDLEVEWGIFWHCLCIYRMRNEASKCPAV